MKMVNLSTTHLATQTKAIFGFLFCLLLTSCAAVTQEAVIQETKATVEADVPYQLKLKRLDGDNFPGLHSMIYATHGDKLILMAGRINGLHGFPTQSEAKEKPSFPIDKKNDYAYLIELATGKVLAQADVTNLPSNIAQQLTATNTQFTVANNVLYVAGGYAYTPNGNSMLILEQVMAVNLDDLAEAITNNTLNSDFAAQSIYVGSDSALAITGGAFEYAESIGSESFLMIFGHRYDGLYSPSGGTAEQEYSQTVRQFNLKLGASGTQSGKPTGSIDVELMGIYPPISRSEPKVEEYHRRDLTILPLLTPSGDSAHIAALGGVFKPGQMAGFVNPVFISGDNSEQADSISLEVDKTITQYMSQYKVATVPVYSQKAQTVYATFFAGISQYYWQDGKLKHDTPNFNITPPIDGLPFINSVSTLKMSEDSSGQYLHNTESFPPKGMEPRCGTAQSIAPYLGAETVFVPTPEIKNSQQNTLKTNMIFLDTLDQPTVVGYLVGGIASLAPYSSGNTCASKRYYEVTLMPGISTDTTLMSIQ